MTKPNAAAFLANMNVPAAVEDAEKARVKPEARSKRAAAKEASPAAAKSATARRSGLKHIGGYFDDDTVEKVAILRARLKLDNSELIKLAIDELFTKQKTARAFGN